jgi:hypothetical protein
MRPLAGAAPLRSPEVALNAIVGGVTSGSLTRGAICEILIVVKE